MSDERIGPSPQRHFRVELAQRQMPIDIYIVGSLKADAETNQRALGQFTAHQFKDVIKRAERESKYVICDMPTGASPKPTWEALQEMVAKGEINLDRVIWVGHESELPPQENPPLGYEAQRMEILHTLGVNVQRITDESAIEQDSIGGNYVSLHNFKPGDQISLEAAQRSAAVYDKLLKVLLDRKDTVAFGMYGVGSDSHGFGELQRYHMWPGEWEKTEDTFVEPLSNYSFEKGLWPIPDGTGGYGADNALWYKRSEFPNVNYLMGLGRGILKRLDHSVHVFNSAGKRRAFIENLKAMGGSIVSDGGEAIQNPMNPGMGEETLGHFKSLADKWLDEGKIRTTSKYADKKTCHEVVREILGSLNRQLKTEEYYELWDLFNLYFGDQTPVSKMLMERAKLSGKRNIIVATADVVRDTLFESLAEK